MSSYTLALALIASRSRSRLLAAARLGTYATCALVAVATFILVYAFQIHDFQIRYVAHYSDRSMSWPLLLAALWGGQDGSLLAWTFALSLCIAACTASLSGRLLQLQPLILAVLASVVAFFTLVMLFAANPFERLINQTPSDGQGLNPLLHNYWMLVHPPVLYLGMVGWAIPFAFVVAALITGRLTDEWLLAVRRWAVFAWITLAMGNLLGMIWSYEELGWGGYWAWDPVENASFLPMLAGTAYLHSAVQQERRGMFKLWTVSLLCLAFFLTIFGTFLTRSGLISSVHAFARSGMGAYFVVYMIIIAVVSSGLIFWRRGQLRAVKYIESLISRDFVFFVNNLLMMGMLLFVAIATIFPAVSEALSGDSVTVGAGFYNRWMVPLGLFLLLLLGLGTLFSWRRSGATHLRRSLTLPIAVAVAVAILHLLGGSAVGYPAFLALERQSDALVDGMIAPFYRSIPLISFSLCAFVLAGHLQEFWRGTLSRMRSTSQNLWVAFTGLVSGARRRYGGYIVHLGLVSMCFGFTGAVYDVEKQVALRPGQFVRVGEFTIRYDRPRMWSEYNKRIMAADFTVLSRGIAIGHLEPAKFIYDKPMGMTTTEVSIRSSLRDDIYAVLNQIDPSTTVGTFRFVVRPFVIWIWIGGCTMLAGAIVCLWPAASRGKKIA
ncbi:MAG: heme lyase CcmF/NrfE family subunit [Deltaproteobacteria bacterium]|nr:heme lyase CcmF/NrfE family subunit [Deltaproteobacteria bacterium]